MPTPALPDGERKWAQNNKNTPHTKNKNHQAQMGSGTHAGGSASSNDPNTEANDWECGRARGQEGHWATPAEPPTHAPPMRRNEIPSEQEPSSNHLATPTPTRHPEKQHMDTWRIQYPQSHQIQWGRWAIDWGQLKPRGMGSKTALSIEAEN